MHGHVECREWLPQPCPELHQADHVDGDCDRAPCNQWSDEEDQVLPGWGDSLGAATSCNDRPAMGGRCEEVNLERLQDSKHFKLIAKTDLLPTLEGPRPPPTLFPSLLLLSAAA